MIFYD
ncbi:hypothetical protein CP082626L3_0944A, partial [Chlamydia psittaci 08-2626_L3]